MVPFLLPSGFKHKEYPIGCRMSCADSYLKIQTPRKSSTLAFFFFLYTFSFLWQMSINSLALSKYINLPFFFFYGGRRFLCLCKESHFFLSGRRTKPIGCLHPKHDFLSYLKIYMFFFFLF